ncbi:unnamed protein product [Rangifer tarandus platyrhynchus]|uniref:Uncharacterized protein n=1 Tax=Rangifer tarandus platyrhynchus TaxID=3082113 RepID=A0ABN8ZYJ7_RANTA|nr:unnamed protein product [Rangifer tarandus platyrhynchus]
MLGEMVTYNDLIVPHWGVESRACVMTPQTKPGMRTEERNPVLAQLELPALTSRAMTSGRRGRGGENARGGAATDPALSSPPANSLRRQHPRLSPRPEKRSSRYQH